MKTLNYSVMAAIIGFSLMDNAMAETMSKANYKAHKNTIDAEYKAADDKCDSFSGNANDICEAEAKGKKEVAKAELEYSYKPTVKNRYKALMAKADADYAVAMQKCDDKDGNMEDVCEKEAKATKVQATESAKVQMKTSKMDSTEGGKAMEVRQDAREDVRDANYSVAKEKCDALSGDAKDACIDKAKIDFGQ